MQYLTNRIVTLAIIVVVVIMAAIVTFKYKEHLYNSDDVDQAFLPELQKNIEKVSTIEITHKDQSLVVEKLAGEWALTQKGGYQVDISKVRQLVLSLADLEKLEAKTSDPDRFNVLGLETPSKDVNSVRIAIFSENGESLADVIIGSLRRTTGSAVKEGAFYIRNTGEDQTWLVKGDIDTSVEENDWVNRELLRLNNEHVAAVAINHSKNANDVNITRIKNEDGSVSFELANLPQGKQVSSQMDIDAIVDVVRNLNFLDVVKQDSKSFSPKNAARTSYNMDGGLVVNLNIWEEKEGKDAATTYWVAVDHQIPGDNAPKAIRDVSERLKKYEGWLYEIGGYQGKLLTKTLPKLTKK